MLASLPSRIWEAPSAASPPAAPTLRRRQVGTASGAALPDAPCVSFYQGDAHGGSRVAELAWHASMHPDRGAFADAWVCTAERAAMPPHLGVIVTYVDVRGAWHATTVATLSAVFAVVIAGDKVIALCGV